MSLHITQGVATGLIATAPLGRFFFFFFFCCCCNNNLGKEVCPLYNIISRENGGKGNYSTRIPNLLHYAIDEMRASANYFTLYTLLITL